jgi:hypothetical protein
LLIHAGIGLALCNWLSIAVTDRPALPTPRIAVEERALVATLGCMLTAKRTKRVIPFLI